MDVVRSFSPVTWGTIAAGAAALLALVRLARPSSPVKDDYYDEETLYSDFVAAARMDEVRPGRKVRVLVLESSKKTSSDSTANVTIFLVHGANARMAQFYDVARKLQNLGYRIVAYDAYGGGRTEKPREWSAYSTEEHKKDFDAIFAKYAAGTGKNFVVGHSFGSVLAVHIAGREPRKVAGLVLLSTAHHVREGGHPILSL
jgi:pimeloyl-ACP methyl ester carboxylesterase